MEEKRWADFVDFLADAAILTDRQKQPIPRASVDAAKLFTNGFLPTGGGAI